MKERDAKSLGRFEYLRNLNLWYKPYRTLEPLPFPPEIIHLILEHLDPIDLARLSLTSFNFRFFAEDHIYRHVNLDKSPVRTILFLRTLTHRPELGARLEALTSHKHPSLSLPQGLDNEILRSARRRLQMQCPSTWSRPLCCASRLHTLDVTLDTSPRLEKLFTISDNSLQYLASASSVLKTLVFRWRSAYMEERDFQLTYTDTARLLANHPSLTHLEIYTLTKIDPLHPGDLPNLQTIVAARAIVTVIVPGRPVRSITVLPPANARDGGPANDGVYSAITRSTVPVTYLKISLGYSTQIEMVSGTLLQYFSNNLPGLEHVAFHGETGYYGRFDDRSCAATARFNSLRTIEFIFTSQVGALWNAPKSPNPLFFTSCPSLLEVYTNEGRFLKESDVPELAAPLPYSPEFKTVTQSFEKDLPYKLLTEESNNKTRSASQFLTGPYLSMALLSLAAAGLYSWSEMQGFSLSSHINFFFLVHWW